MAPPSELIWTILFNQEQLWNKFLMETMLKKLRNSEGKRTEMRPLAE